VNIREIVPALAWIDTRKTKRLLGICVAKFALPGEKNVMIIHENDFERGAKLLCDSRSTNRMFLFQSCYLVGCLTGVTSISNGKQPAYIVERMFLSCHEEMFVRRGCCVCVQHQINYLIQSIS
jgi:hypothetical protein